MPATGHLCATGPKRVCYARSEPLLSFAFAFGEASRQHTLASERAVGERGAGHMGHTEAIALSCCGRAILSGEKSERSQPP